MNFDLERFKHWLGLRRLFLKCVLPLRFPLIVNLEPTNRCNLACRFCPRSRSPRPLADLTWDRFRALADEIAAHGPILRVFLQKDGEPLLHPRLPEMVARLRERNAARTISVITNGTLLTAERFEALARAGLDDLIVSIDAVDAATWADLKGCDRYASVVAQVEAAVARKRTAGWRRPLIKARMVARRGHEAELETFRRRWQGVADAVDITPFHTWMGAVPDERCYQGPARYPCALLWYTAVVNADGRVSPCCIDHTAAGVVGDVAAGGLAAVWNGAALARLRRLHLLGRYRETAICANCEYWQIKEDLGRWLRRKHRLAPPAGGASPPLRPGSRARLASVGDCP